MQSFSFNFTFWTMGSIINLNDNLYSVSLDRHLQPQSVTVVSVTAAELEPFATHSVETWV